MIWKITDFHPTPSPLPRSPWLHSQLHTLIPDDGDEDEEEDEDEDEEEDEEEDDDENDDDASAVDGGGVEPQISGGPQLGQ
jgi:hypothetical protein